MLTITSAKNLSGVKMHSHKIYNDRTGACTARLSLKERINLWEYITTETPDHRESHIGTVLAAAMG